MCREKASPKCCIDNILLIFLIMIMMLIYMYISLNNSGLLAVICIIILFSFILLAVRLEECGFPDWMIKCKNNCKYLCKDTYDDEANIVNN